MTGRFSASPYAGMMIDTAGAATASEGAAAIREMGVRFAIVTDGPRGAWVDHDDFVGHVPAYEVDTVDTTGAGDAFTGGVLTGIINGLGPEEAARLGAATGALATTTLDTFAGPDDPATAWEMAGLRMPR